MPPERASQDGGDIIAIMAYQILVRNLPDAFKRALQERAAEHGRSLEAEARDILTSAVMPEDPVTGWLDGLERVVQGPPLTTPPRRPTRGVANLS